LCKGIPKKRKIEVKKCKKGGIMLEIGGGGEGVFAGPQGPEPDYPKFKGKAGGRETK